MSNSPKIRVAVLTRGESLETWEADALRAVKTLPFAEIVLEIADGTSEENKRFGHKITSYQWKRLFWNRWFKRSGNIDATRPVSTSDIFKGVPRIVVQPQLKGKHTQYFAETDIAAVRSHAPDVILRFGFNILRGEILTIAKHGVWSYHHADHETIRGGPAGFWEYILGHDITGAILQRLTEKLDDGILLRRGAWPLVKHSFRENLDTLLRSTSGWMANALIEIHHTGAVRPLDQHTKSRAPLYSYPGNFRMLQFWMILWKNKFLFHWNNLFRPETWKIGIVNQPIADVVEQGVRSKPKWVKAKHAFEYLADPFSINYNGKNILLAELYSYEDQKGRIVNTETNETFASSKHHSSFPYPISIEGTQYLLPESSESQNCSLYRLPGNDSVITLVEEPLIDPVLYSHDGKWWLFAHHLNHQNNAALFIYYSDDVHKKFIPHSLNPVKTDIRNSRSAGPILNINGRLLRPAQDSSRTYGSAIVVNEILELTPHTFREREYSRIEPHRSWDYNKGIHTISPFGPDQTLIDVKSFRFNFANFKAQWKRKSRRMTGK